MAGNERYQSSSPSQVILRSFLLFSLGMKPPGFRLFLISAPVRQVLLPTGCPQTAQWGLGFWFWCYS